MLDILIARLDEAERARDRVADQLSAERTHLDELKRNQSSAQRKLTRAEDALADLQQQRATLESKYDEARRAFDEVDVALFSKETEFNEMSLRRAAILEQRDALRQRMAELDHIILTPGPELHMERRCIHGHLNCANLPNDVVGVANQQAFDAHVARVRQAEKDKAQLFVEYQQVMVDYEELQPTVNRLDRELSWLKEDDARKKERVESVQRRLNEIDTRLPMLQETYDQCSIDVANIQAQVQAQESYVTQTLQYQLDEANRYVRACEREVLAAADQSAPIAAADATVAPASRARVADPAPMLPERRRHTDEELERMLMREYELQAAKAVVVDGVAAAGAQVAGFFGDVRGQGRRVREFGAAALDAAAEVVLGGVGVGVRGAFAPVDADPDYAVTRRTPE